MSGIEAGPIPVAGIMDCNFMSERAESQAYRCKALEHRRERDDLLARSFDAHGQGLFLASAYYSQLARIHHDAMTMANQRAAAIIASFVNKRHLLTPETTLDLHYLHVGEALALLGDFLERERRRKGPEEERQVVIVTGRGAHSNGPARVKDAVVRFLEHKRMRYTEQNPGRLAVTLQHFAI
ncbi:NEDD4-binding protein 2-like [Penaeus vannamei]|uniref:NEDD4-binding protein 2-like n=1 Tax=Penaeus vannamei TaxID=6689 RepID=UPI00387F5DBD